MVCACLFPSGEKLREKGVDYFFIVTFAIPGKLPELAANLDKDCDSRGQRAVNGLRGSCYEAAGNLQEIWLK